MSQRYTAYLILRTATRDGFGPRMPRRAAGRSTVFRRLRRRVGEPISRG